MLDHNVSDTQVDVFDARLTQHAEFGEQVRAHLRKRWERKPPRYRPRVHIILNKSDMWSAADDSAQQKVLALLESERLAWEALQFVDDVTTASHSNYRTGDVAAVATALRQHWTDRRAVGVT